MNILFLEQYSKISGGQLCLLELIEKLDKQEFTPIVAVPEEGELADRLIKNDIKYIVLPIGSYSTGQKSALDILNYLLRCILLIPRTIKLIRSYKIELVYANAPRTFLWGTIAAKIAGVPLIWHVHSMLAGRVERILVRWLLRFKPGIVVVSRAVAASFLENEELEKVSVVYNGADLKKFNPKISGSEIRLEFNLPIESPVVGIIGQVSEWKGHENFIRAAGIVVKQHPGAKFLIVGEPLYDGAKGDKFLQFLQELIKDLEIEPNIVFTGSRSDIPKLMAALDMVVLASKDPDPCPRVIMEGLASGRPVIATAHGGAPEIIESGQEGFLFKPNDYKELAKNILNLINQPELAVAMGTKAREKAEKIFNIDNYSKQLISIIRQTAPPKK